MASQKDILRRRAARVRRSLKAVANGRPRLSVHRSSKNIYAQVIDDSVGHTLVSASTLESGLRGLAGNKVDKSRKVGELVAERALEAGISAVVFDRGGNKYHGRVAAVAEGARSAGLTL